MKIMLRKIIVIIISFVTIGMMGSCEDIFNDLAVNPNQSDVNSFYTTLENCNKGILGIYGYISTPRNLGACGFGLMLTRSDEGCSVADYGVPGAYNEEFTPSYYSLDNQMHYIYQEGRTVFKYAVSNMADACESIIARNHLSKDNIDWVIPHQANQRIITAVTQRLEVPAEKVMVNIERYGNTSAGTLPLCLWDFEDKLKKGDNLILTAFGAGFAWGAIYVKWGYDGKG